MFILVHSAVCISKINPKLIDNLNAYPWAFSINFVLTYRKEALVLAFLCVGCCWVVVKNDLVSSCYLNTHFNVDTISFRP